MTTWKDIIDIEKQKEYFPKLIGRVEAERTHQIIYPETHNVLRALKETPLEKVKVVLLGQDPYHEEGQACGLAFSVPRGIMIPPSLKNMYKELQNDLGINIPNHGDISSWAEQGVLLLNTVLTVKAHNAMSHHNYGWQRFTDALIEAVNQQNRPIVFILLGNYARSKKSMITNSSHHVIECVHPSPLSASRGFFGSKIFSKTNDFLIKNNVKPIDWGTINK